MFSQRRTLISAAILLLSAESVLSQGSGNCTRFNWDQQPLYLTSEDPQRISAAKVCSTSAQNGTCLVTAEGDESFTYTHNVTQLNSFVSGTSLDVFAESVNATVADALKKADIGPTSFLTSVIAPVDQTRTISPGKAAYLTFAALFFCFTGTTEDCTGAVKNGTPIEVCAPVSRQTSKSAHVTVDGTYELVYIDAANASAFPDPYASQSSGNEVGDEGAAGMIEARPLLTGLAVLLTVSLLLQ